MKNIHSSLSNKTFEIPNTADIERANICSKSGLLANRNCNAYYEYFLTGTAPTTHCTDHSDSSKKSDTSHIQNTTQNEDDFEQ